MQKCQNLFEKDRKKERFSLQLSINDMDKVIRATITLNDKQYRYKQN